MTNEVEESQHGISAGYPGETTLEESSARIPNQGESEGFLESTNDGIEKEEGKRKKTRKNHPEGLFKK